MAQRILIADDEQDFLEILSYHLHQEGFEVITAINGQAALEALSEQPDIIILDIMMPQLSGYEVCEAIRARGVTTPIVFLTARDSDFDEVKGFELGADDYITKPFSTMALLARIKSLLRKSSREHARKNVQVGNLILDMENYSVILHEENIEFTKTEFNLLAFLLQRPNIVHSRDSLLANVWGEDTFVVDRTVDVHVGKIRKKLGDYGDFIETKPGVGYRFNTQKLKHIDQV